MTTEQKDQLLKEIYETIRNTYISEKGRNNAEYIEGGFPDHRMFFQMEYLLKIFEKHNFKAVEDVFLASEDFLKNIGIEEHKEPEEEEFAPVVGQYYSYEDKILLCTSTGYFTSSFDIINMPDFMIQLEKKDYFKLKVCKKPEEEKEFVPVVGEEYTIQQEFTYSTYKRIFTCCRVEKNRAILNAENDTIQIAIHEKNYHKLKPYKKENKAIFEKGE